MDTPLLRTKLYIPPVRPERVARPRLIERLNAGLTRKLTLVSAPAGFGKTTCISAWVHTLDRPVAWLSVDPEDDDPGRFFTYLVAALQQVHPKLGRDIEGVLRSGQLPPGEIISTTLIHDLLAWNDPFVLVLDDCHTIQDPFILQILGRLVAHLPPPLHLVLITREDLPLPLAPLRANNQLNEVGAADLRFTGPEAGRFLNEMMKLSLSPADIALLEDKTEGWIAGLQLAAIAAQSLLAQQPGTAAPSQTAMQASPPAGEQANPSAFIAALSGSHRFILSYLTEEVLDLQPQEIRTFLLRTSILDKLCGDLCDAVTGRTDGHALLERLFHANLFLIPLDDQQQWYRYHHLFADLLRDLENARHEDETAELHRRASRWYAQAGGERGAFVGEAIQHALAAKDYEMAVELLERHAMGMIMQGYVKTVNGWVQAIPEEWALSSPRTNLAFAWMHMLRGAYAQASPYLEQLQSVFAGSHSERHVAEGQPSLQAEWLVMQSLMLYGQGKAAESTALAAQALEIAPEQDSRVRSLAYYALASACQLMEDYPRAVEAYQMAIQHGRAAENLVAEMMSTISLARMAFERGQLHLAFEIAAPVSARIERSGSPPPIGAVVPGVLGEVYYQWLQLDQARRHILRALQLTTLGGYNTGIIFCRVLLSRLSQVEGDLGAAAREIQKAVDLLPVQVPDYVRQEIAAQQVCVYLARDRPAAAQMVLQGRGFSFREGFTFFDLSPGHRISYSTGLLYNSSLRVLVHRAWTERDLTGLRSGIELADRLIAGAFQCQQLLIALEALLLRAQMHAVLGDHQASQRDYAKALELAEPEGFIGVFIEQGPPVAEALSSLIQQGLLGTVHLDYVERILAAFSRSQPPGAMRGERPAPDQAARTQSAALIEPLTSRELEVLGLMARGLKYKEIAARLFVSLNTVRSHVKAIYGKLDVNNRTKAIEMARHLGIL
jgi:LuxR family maltose regulon positive regulatory protein